MPPQVQAQARVAYQFFQRDPRHPGLSFKQAHTKRPIFSARVGLGYRALAVKDKDTVIWFWIGSHGDYEKLLTRL
ncbi:MAG: hypothetical protein ACREMK_02270 [Gemmatimonadota bacterium]